MSEREASPFPWNESTEEEGDFPRDEETGEIEYDFDDSDAYEDAYYQHLDRLTLPAELGVSAIKTRPLFDTPEIRQRTLEWEIAQVKAHFDELNELLIECDADRSDRK